MSTPDTSQPSDTVRVVAPMRLDVLCRLLMEYSERLKQKTSDLNRLKEPGRFSPNAFVLAELEQDVQYLVNQTLKLVNKASSYHEHIGTDEGERFELELRLFDAEDVLRVAQRVLHSPNSNANTFTRDRSKS